MADAVPCAAMGWRGHIVASVRWPALLTPGAGWPVPPVAELVEVEAASAAMTDLPSEWLSSAPLPPGIPLIRPPKAAFLELKTDDSPLMNGASWAIAAKDIAAKRWQVRDTVRNFS